MNIEFPNWLPHEVKEWFSRAKAVTARNSRYARLSTDPRMRDVWEWFEKGRPHNLRPVPFVDITKKLEEEIPTPTQFLITLDRAAYYPGKPSDMTPKEREAYLNKVRKHASALTELLLETKYDRHIFHIGAESIDPDHVEQKVLDDLRSAISWSKSEGGGIMLAYETGDDGEVYEHGTFYPDTSLVDTLNGLIEWTKQDDHFDMLFSVKPVKHSGIPGQKAAYLAALYRRMGQNNVPLPYAHYATAVNVALNLGPEEELDEESAGKQIKRMLKRGDIEEPKQTLVDSDGSLPF